MSRPPLGNRWGDLSPEQRAALPVGTRIGPRGATRGGWLIPRDTRAREDWRWPKDVILSYPPEPDPRDSAGPVDEGGGDAKSGDNDHDGDVREVAYPYGEWAAGRPCRGLWIVYDDLIFDARADVEQADTIGLHVLRLYWPPTCEGAEDAPRDCLP